MYIQWSFELLLRRAWLQSGALIIRTANKYIRDGLSFYDLSPESRSNVAGLM